MENAKRYNPNIEEGLNQEQIQERIKSNLVNYDTTVPTKSIKQILASNFLTLFNFLNLFLAIAIFAVGSYKNMLFLGIIILNTAISTFQEIYSKRVVDKLSVIASAKANVIRNGKKQEIHINDIVLDDILQLSSGNQISTDSIILDGEVEVNESFITGESDTIIKRKGDMLLSGSFIVSGKCYAKVEHVAEENYTAKISRDAKFVKKANSEIMKTLNGIIRILSVAIVPIGIALFVNQLNIGAGIHDAVVKSVAAMIGMIPEGLVLLTSTVLAVSVIRLSKNKVLVQQLYCIETLARVDTLCLDKTGTLTQGKMEVKDFISVENFIKENANNYIENIKNKKDSQNEEKTEDVKKVENALANLAKYSQDENSTIVAIKDKFTNITKEFKPNKIIDFSSKTKWSGINFENEGTYIIGAPEFILKEKIENYKEKLEQYSKDYRVIVLVHSKENFKQKELPDNLELMGFILITDKIRKEAPDTLKYFKEQGVDIKIISGDNPITVSKIAKSVGLENYNNYIDLSTLKTDTEVINAARKYTIFGRVTPEQKRTLVIALKQDGKTVAMTGDGVNDVLALKEADCSIAMASGSDATKSVSELVLLDSNFASMPKVVAEGRRTINNIERSASLFLVKTIYSTILAIMFIVMGEKYPFMPIQLSLISIVAIGIPSFMLALEPNKEKVTGNFMKNVISKAIPTAFTVILGIFALTIGNKLGIIKNEVYSSLCVISTGFTGIMLLFTLSKTRKSENTKLIVSPFRFCLSMAMLLLFIIGLTGFDWWFTIAPLNIMYKEIFNICLVCIINFVVLKICMKKILK